MARKPPAEIKVDTFADHQVISQPNPLRKMVRYAEEKEFDDPVARAEQALASLSGEFNDWMRIECDRLSNAHAAIVRDGLNGENREELFRAAHDIKGGAATFGFPTAAAAAESLCRIIEHAPDLAQVPGELIKHHVNAIQAIYREQSKINAVGMADELSKKLRGVADEYLIHVNRDRPEHLEAIMSPSIVPEA
ncbi:MULTISPECIES: Hpt domain-containing protein [unclassified Afipia]|jgi:HPt (histidine-containing phosphotransfer) domain-containing protein|uniref:Hpt domain-containing protein n=1 Tax=unclassified Afipia TaxID=2642050 RepID=UPI00041EAA58|nr:MULTISPECIES: Hpt domain-containing protein [unclassified Afipia]MBQ8101738.1 Hpt domain-containing protein [Afipia sp.]MBS4002059.1 Hpt domain-containing protein [Afipia sp.]WIG50268.1 MAG: Hpt domain [Afipia sp.]